MSGALVATRPFATVLSEEDLTSGADNLAGELAVVYWTKRGCPERDIEAEANDVINSLRLNVTYRRMRDKLMLVYRMSEHELICALMKEMTPAAIALREAALQASFEAEPVATR